MAKPRVFTSRLTAAALINLPKDKMYLVKVRVFGTTTPGSLSILYDGQANAHFPTPSNGTRGFEDYPVNWGPLGLTLQAAIFAFNGGITIAELQFAEAPSADWKGPPISEYRAIRFARTDAGAVNAAITVNYDKGPGHPEQWICLTSASAGRFQLPTVGGVQEQMECTNLERLPDIISVPEIPDTNSLSLQAISDAAQTLQAIVFY